MTTLEVTGVLHRKMDAQKITDNLTKRDFVIETTEEQYPQLVKFELMNDRCKAIDTFDLGDKVTVSFNLRGREWKKDDGTVAFFTSLNAWRVERVAVEGAAPTKQTSAQPKMEQVAEPVGGDEDLPF